MKKDKGVYIMENILNYLNAHPIFWVIIGVFAVLILVAIIRKMFKLFIILLILGLVYIGYICFTGKEIPKDAAGFIEKGKELLEKGKDAGKDLLDKGKEAGEDLIEKGKEELQKKGN